VVNQLVQIKFNNIVLSWKQM